VNAIDFFDQSADAGDRFIIKKTRPLIPAIMKLENMRTISCYINTNLVIMKTDACSANKH
jgi:hypothetical protein